MPIASIDWSLWLSPWVLGVLGLCIGSFLNVVIHRLPQMLERQWLHESAAQLIDAPTMARVAQWSQAQTEKLAKDVDAYGTRIEELPPLSISRPRSRCPHCGHQLRWHENLPLIGWLRLGGKCAACKAPISARYPVIEAVTGLAFAALSWRFGAQPTTLLWCGFVAALIALAMIDWDTTLLPDVINQPLLWAGLIAALMGWTIPLDKALIGAVAGYLSLFSVAWLYERLRGQIGMAPGDFKLLAALGAWLGWPMLLPVILGASAVGAVVGVLMKLSSSLREGRYVPFGPFLAGGGLVVLFAGQQTVLGWLGWA
ncbi:A24 family peptidase [Roseateles asaccharophilus]|uniref:Prepilin leader peptidase/N-methyltransferase n=1 Tax=Roseateles asaccharophilus TaxID=582607 RepID=A0ABU2A1X3_9BURK|nr:A24 family peptidase [Roseateles asaccharophilus]MDR7331090.1 leader peptidase (prepilin peptidase)/N-methyltransferase [Roseateles asaccharophilus]